VTPSSTATHPPIAQQPPSRREVLRAAAASAAAAVLTPVGAFAQEGQPAFRHGVASGDPLADRVVLWTRVSGVLTPTPVVWTVATDRELAQVVASGAALAAADSDFCLSVDVDGLSPASTYYYGFSAGGVTSPVGRTRTSRAREDGREIRLGVVSCSSYADGPFVAYARLVEKDVDLVVHLGDYIYEASAADGDLARPSVPDRTPVTLADYRARHAQYREDPDLQRLTATVPLAAVWDDHDVADNAWRGGAPRHDPGRDGPWELRRAAALRAWLEWMPVRRPDPMAPERIWRSLDLGGVAELLLLDTRHDGRDRQVAAGDPDPAAAVVDRARSLVSGAQRDWLTDRLRGSAATWRVLANQVVLSPLGLPAPGPLEEVAERIGLVVDGEVINPDAWDGYVAERRRLVDVLASVPDSVVLTGDIHSSWALDVPGADGPVAVEIVVPSVTSTSFADQVAGPDLVTDAIAAVFDAELRHLRWVDLSRHGYAVVSLTPGRVAADWWHVDLAEGTERRAASWGVDTGDRRLHRSDPLADRTAPPAPPDLPPEPARRGDDPPWAALGAAGAAGVATVAGAIGLRRRRS
jgi:alkaline phosphatase D